MQTSAPRTITIRGIGSTLGAVPLVSWSTVLVVVAMALAAAAVVSPAATRAGTGTWAIVAGVVAAVGVDRLAHGVRRRVREPVAGPAWLIVVTVAAAVGPAGSLRAAGIMAAAVVAVDVVRHRSLVTAAGRFVALVMPAGVFAIVASMAVPGSPGAGFAGGLVAAGTSLLLTRAVLPVLDPTVFVLVPPHRHLAVDVAEWATLGAAAGVIGAVLPGSGWIAAPIFVAGLATVVVADLLRRQSEAVAESAVDTLLAALEAKDLYTRGHAERVGLIAGAVGQEMGMEGVGLHRLVTAARLHDIGKIAVPRSLLRKPGRLTSEEQGRIQRHVDVVPEILGGIPALAPVIPIIVEHHVPVDAAAHATDAEPVVSSLPARILAVADAFDAMTTHRRYRKALTLDLAFAELRRCAGGQFDPDVVEALIRVIQRTGADPVATGSESEGAARSRAERSAAHAG